MKKRDKAEELMKTLENIEPLDDVPAGVSSRFQETLASLALRDSQVKSKKSWLIGSNQFALAASFTLVFALGAIFTLNSGSDSGDSIGVSQNQSTDTSAENDVKEDELLYSTGEGSIPVTSNTPIELSNSAHDYLTIPGGFQKSLGVGNTWNSTSALEPSVLNCLKSIELDRSTNLIDNGFVKKQPIKAIWTPVTSNSWNVYLVGIDCSVIEKKYVEEG